MNVFNWWVPPSTTVSPTIHPQSVFLSIYLSHAEGITWWSWHSSSGCHPALCLPFDGFHQKSVKWMEPIHGLEFTFRAISKCWSKNQYACSKRRRGAISNEDIALKLLLLILVLTPPYRLNGNLEMYLILLADFFCNSI